MKYPSEITFDIESNPEYAFQALYEGLRLVVEREKKAEKPGMFSFVGAEAYSMLQDLEINYPKQFKHADECCDI